MASDLICAGFMQACLGFDWEEWPVMWFAVASCRLVLALIGKSGQ